MGNVYTFNDNFFNEEITLRSIIFYFKRPTLIYITYKILQIIEDAKQYL